MTTRRALQHVEADTGRAVLRYGDARGRIVVTVWSAVMPRFDPRDLDAALDLVLERQDADGAQAATGVASEVCTILCATFAEHVRATVRIDLRPLQ